MKSSKCKDGRAKLTKWVQTPNEYKLTLFIWLLCMHGNSIVKKMSTLDISNLTQATPAHKMIWEVHWNELSLIKIHHDFSKYTYLMNCIYHTRSPVHFKLPMVPIVYLSKQINEQSITAKSLSAIQHLYCRLSICHLV